MSLSAKKECVKKARRGYVGEQRILSTASLCTPAEQAAWNRCARFNTDKRKKFLIADLILSILALLAFFATELIDNTGGAAGSAEKTVPITLLMLTSIVLIVISFTYQIVFIVNKSKPIAVSILCMFKSIAMLTFVTYASEVIFKSGGDTTALLANVFMALSGLAALVILEVASLKKRL